MSTLVDLNTLEDLDDFLLLASREDTHSDTLTELSQELFIAIRAEVAANPATPSDVLLELSTDDSGEVVWQVAANPHTPVEALYLLKQADYQLSTEAEARVSEALQQYRQAYDLDGIPDNYIAKLMWG